MESLLPQQNRAISNPLLALTLVSHPALLCVTSLQNEKRLRRAMLLGAGALLRWLGQALATTAAWRDTRPPKTP